MALTGQQRKRLHEALINGFPNMASLEQMLSYELDKDLRKVAGEGSLENIVFQLIKIADCDGWIDKLICGACTSNPENERLRAIKEELLPNLNQETFPTSKTGHDSQKTNQHPLSESSQEEPKIFQQSSRSKNHDQASQEYEHNFRQLLRDGHPTYEIRHEELKRWSRLSEGEINQIERRVNEEYELEEQKYEQALVRVIWRFIILGLFVSPRLRSIPPSSKLCDNDLKRIYSCLKRNALRRATERAISSAKILLLIALIAFLGYRGYRLIFPIKSPYPPYISHPQPDKEVDISKKISYGKISLFPLDFFRESMSKQRTPIIDSFNKAQTTKQYEKVVILFNDYFRNNENRNDAEARIFKNNAMARAKDNPPLTIGVSVPIGASPNVAMEILRGVAQAQDEFNDPKSKRGRLLQVIIGDDENDENKIESIAHEFVSLEVLAVIGSNNTRASLKAAPIYDERKIVMISPTAFGDGFNNYSHALQMVSETAVDELIGKLGEILSPSSSAKTKILICVDETSYDSKNFIGKFESNISKLQKFEINKNDICHLNAQFDEIIKALTSASKNGTNAILLAPQIDEKQFKKAIDVAKELKYINKRLDEKKRLKLFGSPTMNAAYIRKEGEEDVYIAFNGMKVSVPWNPYQGGGKTFLNNANCLWGGDVNWRTAMAFDATNAIINRLRANPNKVDINQIKSGDYDFYGATGKVSFAGNRQIEASIVEFKDEGKNSGFTPRGEVKMCKSNSN